MELFCGQISSPRISFSQDLAAAGCGLSRVSPEQRKWEASDETEFEFRMCSNKLDMKCGCAEQQLGGGGGGEVESMVSADMLFSDGKLRPLLLPPPPPLSDCDLYPPLEHKHSLHRAQICPGFDFSGRDHYPVPCLSRANYKSSPPPRPALPPVSPEAPPKYSAKIKEFFRPRKATLPPCMEIMEPLPSQLSRHNSVTSSCRLPISPKAFWPFSRSNSAVESKTTPVVPAFTRRSNSADTTPSSTCGTSSCSTVDSSGFQGMGNCLSIPIRGSERVKGRADSNTCISSVPAVGIQPVSSASQECSTSCSLSVSSSSALKSSSLSLERADHHSRESATLPKVSGSVGTFASPKQSDQSSNAIVAFKDLKKTALMNATRVRGYASPGRMARRAVSSPARNFTRGSHGRKGIWNGPGVEGNASRIVLRNLQRCSAGTSLRVARKKQEAGSRDGFKESERRDSHSVTVREAPVLNVAIYKKTASKAGLFRFGNLFSSKKQKPIESPLNNWRNGI